MLQLTNNNIVKHLIVSLFSARFTLKNKIKKKISVGGKVMKKQRMKTIISSVHSPLFSPPLPTFEYFERDACVGLIMHYSEALPGL